MSFVDAMPADVLKRIAFDPWTGCWHWMGSMNNNGYGFMYKPVRRRVLAHRVTYEAAKGLIPSHLEIDHLCRVRCCVNPAHLEAVTRQVNQHRGMGPIGFNARKTHCIRGHLLSGDNLMQSVRAGRICRPCSQMKAKQYYFGNHEKVKAHRRAVKQWNKAAAEGLI